MARKRSLNIWHVPKRGSIHQMVGALTILSKFKINGKYWPSARKKFDQKFAMWGFTERGRSLSRNASETLEALLKYMGLVIVDQDRHIHITPAGNALLQEFSIKEPRKKKIRLKETEKQIGDITSSVLKTQMTKLTLTNPSVKTYCQDVLVMPFRETLLLINDLSYLTLEEIAMFLFHMKDGAQRGSTKSKIKSFRKLDKRAQQKRINKYLKTPDGNLTLKQAPTATYWMQLCRNTGLCEKEHKNLVIKKEKIDEVKQLLKKFPPDEKYDFKDDLELWHRYFTNIEIRETPFDITVKLKGNSTSEFLVTVFEKETITKCRVLSCPGYFDMSVFPQQKYTIDITNLDTGELIKTLSKRFTKKDRRMIIKLPHVRAVIKDFEFYAETARELISSEDFDERYKNHLKAISMVTHEDFLSKKYRGMLRGGRLEFLFYKLLEKLENEEIIKELKWNGSLSELGFARPAPAGKTGAPDITFKINNITILLELTTIPSPSAQWTAEGSSVPYHVANFVKEKGNTNVYGIFSAPTMHEKVVNSLKSALIPAKCKILCITVEELIQLLGDKKNVYQNLRDLIREEYPQDRSNVSTPAH